MRFLCIVAASLLLLTTNGNAKEPAPTTRYRIDGKSVSEQAYSELHAKLKLQEPPGCKKKSGGGTVFWQAQDASGQHYRVESTTDHGNKEESIERVPPER